MTHNTIKVCDELKDNKFDAAAWIDSVPVPFGISQEEYEEKIQPKVLALMNALTEAGLPAVIGFTGASDGVGENVLTFHNLGKVPAAHVDFTEISTAMIRMRGIQGLDSLIETAKIAYHRLEKAGFAG